MTQEQTSEIKNIIDRALEQNPENKEIIKAFAPIIIRQRQLAEKPSEQKLDCLAIDKQKLKAGVPVSRQINLILPGDPLKEIALSLAEAVKEGMPQLTENIDLIAGLIKDDKIKPADYFKSTPDGESMATDVWAKDLKVSPSNASFLMSLVSRVILEQRANEITAAIGAFDWEKGYCPICGEFPSIALIEEEGGKRFLHCSACGYYWRFTRVSCPYCEKETRQGMEYFYVENKKQESAFVCDQCKKYLVTLYRAGQVFARDMDVSAISLIHMDLLMQNKGYEPMTACTWNVLS
ncbi:MAG TPA: formate dehydrogenase accessory protein FdhE [Smithella sp.]|jgi:FdhE protein|nr:formate dehydrogenase accessory protein FdhE [Smithella sp.]NMC97616.1 formate dehydrogenase accessory protein FdhE [Deltaproteobacteria bacterium]OQC51111.1 MAG: formate dehydrogenase accessory protein FdhE [Deltaproteobacteria bacterium ADurb.Bin022]HNQ66571.1 formate dehydrogenase accessory protein FdhE [Smithella sp.]HOG10881.1 formate dehydrogenase accessory protein FdhE [Smithella sp.]